MKKQWIASLFIALIFGQTTVCSTPETLFANVQKAVVASSKVVKKHGKKFTLKGQSLLKKTWGAIAQSCRDFKNGTLVSQGSLRAAVVVSFIACVWAAVAVVKSKWYVAEVNSEYYKFTEAIKRLNCKTEKEALEAAGQCESYMARRGFEIDLEELKFKGFPDDSLTACFTERVKYYIFLHFIGVNDGAKAEQYLGVDKSGPVKKYSVDINNLTSATVKDLPSPLSLARNLPKMRKILYNANLGNYRNFNIFRMCLNRMEKKGDPLFPYLPREVLMLIAEKLLGRKLDPALIMKSESEFGKAFYKALLEPPEKSGTA